MSVVNSIVSPRWLNIWSGGIRWLKSDPKRLLPYRSFTCCIDLNVQQCWPNTLKPYVNTVGGKYPEQWTIDDKIRSRFILFILWIFCSGFPQGALCSDASHCVGMYLEEPLWRNNWCLHAPNFLGFVPGVWLVVKRHTRCLVIASTVAWRVVIKPKRTRCSPSKHCVTDGQIVLTGWKHSHTLLIVKIIENECFTAATPFYGHYKQNSVLNSLCISPLHALLGCNLPQHDAQEQPVHSQSSGGSG